MTKTDRTNAARQARWRENQKKKMLELEQASASKTDQEDETIRLKAEIDRLREALRASTGELARLEDERDSLKLELARLRQDQTDQDKPKAKRPGRKKPAT